MFKQSKHQAKKDKTSYLTEDRMDNRKWMQHCTILLRPGVEPDGGMQKIFMSSIRTY